MLKQLKRDALDFGAMGAALAVAQAVALCTNILVARGAGPSVFGQFTAFIAMVALTTTVCDALDPTFIRLSGRLDSAAELAAERGAHLIAKVGFVVLTTVVGLGLIPWLEYLGWLMPGTSLIFGIGIVVGGLVSIYHALITQCRQQKLFFRTAALLPALNLFAGAGVGLLVLLHVPLGQGHVAAVYALVSGGLALVASGAIIIWSSFRCTLRSRAPLARYLHHGLPLVGAALVGVLSSRLDIFFLSAFQPFEELGFYGAGLRIAACVALLNATVSLMIQPRAATALHSLAELHQFARFSLMCCVLTVCVAGSIYLSADVLIDLFFGENYRVAVAVTSILLLQSSFNGCSLPFKAMLQCHQPTALVFKFSCLQLTVAAILMVLLVPHHGAVGAAWAVTAASGVGLVLFVGSTLRVVMQRRRAWDAKRHRDSLVVNSLESSVGSPNRWALAAPGTRGFRGRLPGKRI